MGIQLSVFGVLRLLITQYSRFDQHHLHDDCTWLPTRRESIIRPWIHVPWPSFPKDLGNHYFGNLYLNFNILAPSDILTVYYSSDIFEMCYRPTMRFSLLCHHFCVRLTSALDFFQGDWYWPFRPYLPSCRCLFPSKSQVYYPWISQCWWQSDWLIPAHPATITAGLIWIFQVFRLCFPFHI